MLQLWIFYYFNIVLIALKIQSAWKCINEVQVWILRGESDEDIYRVTKQYLLTVAACFL